MKLYQYDHCPFCVRADMLANYKEVAHDKVYLLNDDEATCFALIGAKQLPILQFDDGTCLAESMDIAHRLDEIGNPARPLRARSDIQPLLDAIDAVRPAINGLLFPRNIALGLPEFETAASREYFQRKKEQILGIPFAEALARGNEYRILVEQMLDGLPPLPEVDHLLGWDDVMLYPTLRNLSMVHGLKMPARVRDYLEAVAALSGTHLYFDRAI